MTAWCGKLNLNKSGKFVAFKRSGWAEYKEVLQGFYFCQRWITAEARSQRGKFILIFMYM